MNRETYLQLRKQNAISNILHKYINDELKRPISMDKVSMLLAMLPSQFTNNIVQTALDVYDSKYNIVIVSYNGQIVNIM